MTSGPPVDYGDYMSSARWRNISAAMKKYANFTCQRCKARLHPSELDVHHLNYERMGKERISDLQVLCRSKCHPIADANRAEQDTVRREQRRSDTACDTYLSKKYGDNYASFEDESMHREYERWRTKKHYGETGEDW